jgi:hypothetical protein
VIRARVLKRFTLNGTIDNHDPIGVTFRITGGLRPFRLTVVSVNWGRGYDPGEFKGNVMRVLERVADRQYVVLLVQELDEADGADEHRVFEELMEPGTTLVGWVTREPIAVSPGVKVTRKRRTLTMEQGTRIGAPVGTGPRRYLVSCIATIEGVRIGFGNQHPHRNLTHAKVQKARRRGERVTREVIGELAELCDLVIHGGDMNDRAYPKAHPRERIVHTRDLDTIRLVASDHGPRS